MANNSYAIEMNDISMSFGGIHALQKVNFKLKAGEVRGLIGENGAGKSTLMKVLMGVHVQKEGIIKIFDHEIPKNSSVKERLKYLGMVFQEFSLIPELSVLRNIFLDNEPKKGFFIDDKKIREVVQKFFKALEIEIDIDEKIKNLNTHEMQMVEISKSLLKNKKILIMDEPTAALQIDQKEKLFKLIKRLKEEGVSVIFITHYLKDVMNICDSITVLRDGKVIISEDASKLSLKDIVGHMLGKKAEIRSSGSNLTVDYEKPLLEIKSVTSRELTEKISFTLYEGEILGLAGLKGSGQSEILNCIYGVSPNISGTVRLNEKIIQIRNPEDAMNFGITLIPGNRQVQGLILTKSLYFNVSLPILKKLKGSLFINDKKGKQIAQNYVQKLLIKTNDILDPVMSLSGGNQQKVVISKSLATNPHIMLLDDPTLGVDIQAKSEVMKIVQDFAKQGNGVIFVSSDFEELLNICNRIIIIKNGQITQELRNIKSLNLEELTTVVHS